MGLERQSLCRKANDKEQRQKGNQDFFFPGEATFRGGLRSSESREGTKLTAGSKKLSETHRSLRGGLRRTLS